MEWRTNQQAYRLMVNDYSRPWAPAKPEATQVRCYLGWVMGLRYPRSLDESQLKRYFTPFFSEVVVSLWPS